MASNRKVTAGPRLDAFRVGKGFRLKDIDAAARPFASSSREADDAKLVQIGIEIDRLQDVLYANASTGQHKLLVVLQGMDTSGKDGTARAVFQRCSPLGVRVAAFKAPSEEERARDFLWRVHAVVPRAGEIAIFNRSHYEDVLVPVVEGWIDGRTQRDRFARIVEFERLLADTGTTVLKCMLHISKDEQKRRLQARLDDPAKRWKFQLGDLAVRAKWKDYQAAYQALLVATSTRHAPWYVVPADSKTQRNLMVATLVRDALAAMKLAAPKPDYDPKAVSIV
ncbi:MAG TPA: PPK2 family polyphosphate kinase [Methylibium sp.]|uniref:PPK2 family polyphosphate kinase n=1 Tax=Methylibium sp. TaxID=2067992 RepID=UPI002DB9855B|nr:PPK2 family polyphosphate kinase [Methylibium sp.]HEU4457884.1 PPK2 family polyphosphate kinase [Methylibium sp.]